MSRTIESSIYATALSNVAESSRVLNQYIQPNLKPPVHSGVLSVAYKAFSDALSLMPTAVLERGATVLWTCGPSCSAWA